MLGSLPKYLLYTLTVITDGGLNFSSFLIFTFSNKNKYLQTKFLSLSRFGHLWPLWVEVLGFNGVLEGLVELPHLDVGSRPEQYK